MKKLLYEDIYEQFKRLITEKTYQEGSKLPSKRKLSATLKVSPLTVEAAYAQLIAEGYVYAIEKKGYFVSKQVELRLSDIKERSFHLLQDEKVNHDIKYRFETNVVDTSLFPNATWAKLSREVISENHHEMLNMTPPQGLYELRVEIAKYLDIYRGMHVSHDQIIIGSGSTSLIGMIVELLGRKLTYGIEKPGFIKIEKLFKANDVNIKHVPLDQHGLSVEKLNEKAVDVIHVTPSHQYPTGIVMPISRRIELLNWALEHHAYIIEDDYDSEFRFQGKPIPALQGLDQHDRVIYMNTFTKSLAPSFRMSYMVLPKSLLERYHHMSSYHACTVPTFEQYVLYKFMQGGSFERHINRMRNHYKEKLEVIRHLIKEEDVILHGDDAGLHFLMEIKGISDLEKLKKSFENHHISVSYLSTDDIYPMYQHPCLIIGYSGILTNDLVSSFQTLMRAIKKAKQ